MRRASIDRRLYDAVNRLPHTPYLDEQVTLLSDLGKGAGWVAGAAWLALRDGRRGRRAALASTGAMLLAVTLVQGPIKGLVRRRRPFTQRVARVVGVRPTDPSFPSGHTAGSFAAAVALTTFYPADAPILLGLATAVGISRVYLGHHFLGDVLAGAGMGAGLGLLARRLVGKQPGSSPRRRVQAARRRRGGPAIDSA